MGFERATVHFKLRAASVEQNNVKGEKRFFLPAAPEPVTWDAESRILTVGFEYRPLTDGEKLRFGTRDQQDKLLGRGDPRILKATPDPLMRDRLAESSGEPGKEKSLLARHLTRYATRNTRDYFIHKDLRAFLTRELDFFLKNEVLRLEDLDFDRPATMQPAAARLKTIRLIAGRIIDFLAQIEDFQRRLWEKRKFVMQSDTCVTLDRVPPALYARSRPTTASGRNGGNSTAWKLGSDADLGQHPFAMVDTAFFDAGFKARLLASFADLNATCDGLLVHGENYQALRLLTPRYAGQVKCIYIDPPYNTGDGDFPYKDDFFHSSWLAMLEDRISMSHDLQSAGGTLIVSIDDVELSRLINLLERVYGPTNALATLVWDRNRKNDAKYFSVGHEYMAVFATDKQFLRDQGKQFREPKEGLAEVEGAIRRESLEIMARTGTKFVSVGSPGLTIFHYQIHVDV